MEHVSMGVRNSVCKIPESLDHKEVLSYFLQSVREENWCDAQFHRIIQAEGNQKKGTIIHFAQAHNTIRRDVTNNIFEDCSDKDTVKMITLYQRQIFEQLKVEKIQAVFLESLTDEDLDNSQVIKNSFYDIRMAFRAHDIPDLREELNIVMQKYGVQNITDLQNKLLYLYGGGLIYGVVNEEGVVLRGAENEKLLNNGAIAAGKLGSQNDMERAQDSLVNGGFLTKWENSIKIGYAREQFLFQVIKEYLVINPGERIAVVYGMGHNLIHSYHGAFGIFDTFRPRLERIIIPEQAAFIVEKFSNKSKQGEVCQRVIHE